MPAQLPLDRIPQDQVLIGDCVAQLAKQPAASVDLVFADTPYNLQLQGEQPRFVLAMSNITHKPALSFRCETLIREKP